MFTKTIVTSTLLLLCYALGIFFFAVQVRSEDQKTYRTLLKESAALHSKRALEKEPAIQQRFEVQKDIWTLDGEERPHIRLISQDSTLTIRQRGKKFKANEKLHHITCWMQEKINRSDRTQQLRYLQAGEGTYEFPSHQFLAQHVHLSFHHLLGIDIPDTALQSPPYLKGIAQKILFHTSSKIPTFTAEHLRAELVRENRSAH